MSDKFSPNLFILGAAKSGTTSLYNFLNSYDEICMSSPKEPFFFELEYEKGLDFYRKKYFKHYKNERFIGDARHRNLFLPFVPERIYKTNPNAKLIVILRNPIERAYSHWWHFYSRRIEKKSFSYKIEEEIYMFKKGVIEDFFSNPNKYAKEFMPYGEATITSYILSSIYSIQIERYLKLFGSDNIYILNFEELKSNPVKELSNLISWIFEKDMEVHELHKDNEAKQKDLYGVWYRLNNTFSMVKKVIPDKWVGRIKEKVLSRPKIKRKDFFKLNQFFKPYNEALKQYVGFDVDKWQKD